MSHSCHCMSIVVIDEFGQTKVGRQQLWMLDLGMSPKTTQ